MDLSQKRRNFRISLITAVVLSLFIHLLWAGAVYIFKPQTPSTDRIEVQLIEQPDKVMPKLPNMQKDAAKQIVDQDEKPINEEIDQKAKYLSAHNQKVEKQTRAKNFGEFQNTPNKSAIAGDGGQAKKVDVKKFAPDFDVSKAVREREQREKEIDNDPEGVKIAKAKPQNAPSPQAAKPGNGGEKLSQSIDYIKDLDPGLETLLSTREFVYYTYYARIRRQVNQFWTPKIKEKVQQIYRSGRSIASSEDKITRCLVTLDKLGNLTRVQIIGVSGVRELDEAAVEAFKEAGPFPNPPMGIVDEDGTIKIRWDFILEV